MLRFKKIRSFRKDFDESLVMLTNSKVNFHCIILTEAWNDDSYLWKVRGYNLFIYYTII